MDFWTRLVGGVSNRKSLKSSSSTSSSPQQRLQRFRRAYNPILQLCGRPQTLVSHGPALDQLNTSLARVVALLREESRTPAPHLCLSFAADSQIYSVVARAAATSRDDRLVRQAVTVFSLLLESEDDGFVASPAFAKSLMRFAFRVIDSSMGMFGEEVESDVVEVLFGVVAKIRVEPGLLPVWFRKRPHDDPDTDNKGFAGVTQKDDFPLCYLLIDRIHHDGRTGDFARTGLLYIFEAVAHSSHLEDWIIDSDLPTLMASGLGALYSQLSRELSILHDHDHLPMILALSDYIHIQPSPATESVFSHAHATHMTTFLSHLAFWQDVLEHCRSDSVKNTLLDHFRILFLQQLLYPSLLQSSDTDGGSSVAVLTYLSNMFETLDHPDLTQIMLRYLLAIPDTKQPGPASHPPAPTVTRRMSSLLLLSRPQSDEDQLEPALFSMVDLVLNGVKSRNPQTAVAALKLSSVMLTRHRNYALSTMLQTSPASAPSGKRTIGALCSETDNLMHIAIGFGGEYDIDEAYATACQDVAVPLEIQLANRSHHGSDPVPLNLTKRDPYLLAIIGLFESFFTNNVDVNLALTEAVVCLASCADIRLEGWLAVSRADYGAEHGVAEDDTLGLSGLDEEEAANLRLLKSVHNHKRSSESPDPIMPSLLQSLQHQVETMRSDISSIDYSITKRIAILGGVGREEAVMQPKASTASGRPSSDFGAADGATGESRQIQRLRSESVAKSRSRASSRSSTPSRARPSRANSSSAVPPRSTSLSQAPQVRQPAVFRPPPPDPQEDDILQPAGGDTAKDPESRENEAQTLQRTIRFVRAGTHTGQVTGRVFDYIADPAFSRQNGDTDGLELRESSLSHVVTNIVILQHFVLELAAVMRTRAIVFEEVEFA